LEGSSLVPPSLSELGEKPWSGTQAYGFYQSEREEPEPLHASNLFSKEIPDIHKPLK